MSTEPNAPATPEWDGVDESSLDGEELVDDVGEDQGDEPDHTQEIG